MNPVELIREVLQTHDIGEPMCTRIALAIYDELTDNFNELDFNYEAPE